MDEEILSRIVLTPAEKQVMIEQALTQKTALDLFVQRIQAGDTRGLVLQWADMTQTWEYMSNVLQAKTNRAIHTLMQERGQ